MQCLCKLKNILNFYFVNVRPQPYSAKQGRRTIAKIKRKCQKVCLKLVSQSNCALCGIAFQRLRIHETYAKVR